MDVEREVSRVVLRLPSKNDALVAVPVLAVLVSMGADDSVLDHEDNLADEQYFAG
jgi:hypothetical protein